MESRQDKQVRMFGLVEQYHRGNETQEQFCESAGLKIHCFRYWLSRYEHAQQSEVGFVRVAGQSKHGIGNVSVQYPNGVSLCFEKQVDFDLLAQLIRLW